MNMEAAISSYISITFALYQKMITFALFQKMITFALFQKTYFSSVAL